MSSARIGIFDSGIGGLTVAREIKQLLPNEGLFYVADNGRAPYGPRDAAEIQAFSQEITHYLLEQGVSLIVVACNTATSAAIDQLRANFPNTPFVGMEPAVKPAATQSTVGRIGVMATELTLSGERYQELVRQYAPDVLVVTDPCKGLVPLIEGGHWSSVAIQDKLNEILQPMLQEGIDTLVLGCTHYPLLKQQIQRTVGEDVTIIDPAPAAARQAVRLLTKRPASAIATQKPLDEFRSTGSSLAVEKTLGRMGWRWRRCSKLAKTIS